MMSAATDDDEHIDLSRAVFLDDVESNDDPESEPYRSKYKARSVYQETLADLKSQLESCSEEVKNDLQLQLKLDFLTLRLALNYLDTEEIVEGEKLLKQLLDWVDMDDEMMEDPFESIILVQRLLNHMAFVHSERNRFVDSESDLLRSEKLFLKYKRQWSEKGRAVVTFDRLFFPDKVTDSPMEEDLDRGYTKTLFYLAQICGKLNRPGDSAKYCRMTLSRQLMFCDYDSQDWAINCATLGQYYLSVNQFAESHHCMCCASCIFNEAERPSDDSDKLECWKKASADLDRCWSKYGLALLDFSADCLLGKKTALNDDEVKYDHFFDLETANYEKKVAWKVVTYFEEARPVFLFIQERVRAASSAFYLLEDHCTDYIDLVQDHSRAFRLLAYFELDTERQCRMHKRRIDMLTDLLHKVNPQHFLIWCRQLRFELAEVFNEMMTVKRFALEDSLNQENADKNIKMKSTKAAAKINSLALASIAHFDQFIDSFRQPNGNLPDQFEVTDVRFVLLAYFHRARLYSKLLELDKEKKLGNLERAREYYKFICDYCDRYPDAERFVEEELSVVREMYALMNVKVQTEMEKLASNSSS